MIFSRKKRLAVAVAGALGLGTTIAHAVDFNATATLQNTLAVTADLDFDIGTVFATETGAALTDGVGALVISPEGGTPTDPTDSATVNLTSLTTPVPAQGSVAMAANFSLQLPDTDNIDPADFVANAGTTLANITANPSGATELVHESGNPAVPSLYLMHFTVGDVSGGVAAPDNPTTNDGAYTITQDFGETTYVFTIGATLTTKPTAAVETYQEGIYSGTFEVTAAY